MYATYESAIKSNTKNVLRKNAFSKNIAMWINWNRK